LDPPSGSLAAALRRGRPSWARRKAAPFLCRCPGCKSFDVHQPGEEFGDHLFNESKDRCTPFEIRIDPFIDWNRAFQLFTVRVEDKSGAGGIWNRVWLVSKE